MPEELEKPSENNSHEKNVKISIDSVLGGKTSLRKVKKTADDIRRDIFVQVITNIEKAETREFLLTQDFELDLTVYNNTYNDVIDGLLQMIFNQTQLQFVDFYLYNRLDEDNELVGLEGPDGSTTYLESPVDLYEFLKRFK